MKADKSENKLTKDQKISYTDAFFLKLILTYFVLEYYQNLNHEGNYLKEFWRG